MMIICGTIRMFLDEYFAPPVMPLRLGLGSFIQVTLLPDLLTRVSRALSTSNA